METGLPAEAVDIRPEEHCLGEFLLHFICEHRAINFYRYFVVSPYEQTARSCTPYYARLIFVLVDERGLYLVFVQKPRLRLSY